MSDRSRENQDAVSAEPISGGDEFDKELRSIMEAAPTGKKKRKWSVRNIKNWSKKKKIVAGAVVIVLALLLFSGLGGKGKGSATPMVGVMPLAKGDIVQKLSVSGPVSGTDSVEVVSNLHAEILEIPVKEGDKVTKGQILAALDSKDIQKEVDIAQNAYDLAVSTYQEKNIEAENGYAKAQQDYQDAKGEYERQSALHQAGTVSQVDLQKAQNAMNDAKRHLKTFNIKDGKAVANDSYALEVESRAFELDQKKTALENTKVKSPIDGTVVRVNCKVGRFADKVDDDKPMFIIDNLDVLEMRINVSEYSIGKVMVGQKATISADILGEETVTGEVTAISPTGEEKGGGSAERIIPTTLRIIDQNTKLIAGITAKAEIVLAESKDTWIIPISALIQQPDGSYSVAAVQNNSVHMIPVEAGVESDVEVEIHPKEEGTLTEGMQIIVNGSPMYTEGMAVTVGSGM